MVTGSSFDDCIPQRSSNPDNSLTVICREKVALVPKGTLNRVLKLVDFRVPKSVMHGYVLEMQYLAGKGGGGGGVTSPCIVELKVVPSDAIVTV
jgi:hypothetical protein